MGVTIIRREEAPRFEVHGASVIAQAAPSRGSASIASWRLSLPAGAASPLHSLDADEIFHCLGGEAEFAVGEQRFRVRGGDAVTIAAGTRFQFHVVGGEPFEAIACITTGCKARVEEGEPFTPPWAV